MDAQLPPIAILRTSRTMWILFGAPFPVIAIAAAIEAIIVNRVLWIPAVVLGLFSAVHLSWLKTTSLSLTDHAVHYRALFVQKDILLTDIIRAKFKFGPKASGPMQRVVFDVRGDAKHNKITVNAGLFDGHQSRDWLKALNSRIGMAT